MKTIMIVDDEEDIRVSVKNVVEDAGFKTILAVDGQDCLNKLKKNKPDLILLDIMMPGLTSKEIIAAIRKNKSTSAIKIIFLTVVRLADISQKDLMCKNVVDFIEKPFSNNDLIKTIKKTIKDKPNVKTKIKKSHATLFFIPDKNYNVVLIRTIKKIVKNNKVCYTSLNKGRGAMINFLKKNKVKLNNFFFIDSITSTVTTTKNTNNCIFVSSPNSLTELESAINKVAKKQKSKFIIFDSLSTLLIYHKKRAIVKFVNDLMDKVKKRDSYLIFTMSGKGKEHFKKFQKVINHNIKP